jgi:hypothetical protein
VAISDLAKEIAPINRDVAYLAELLVTISLFQLCVDGNLGVWTELVPLFAGHFDNFLL